MKKKILSVLIMSVLVLTGCSSKNNEKKGDISFKDSLGIERNIDKPEKVAVMSGDIAQAWNQAGGKISITTNESKDENKDILSKDVSAVGKTRTFDVDKLISQKPDFVILDSEIPYQKNIKDELENAGIDYAYFRVDSFKNYEETMKAFEKITGDKEKYTENVENVKNDVENTKKNIRSKPRVLFIEGYFGGVKIKDKDSVPGSIIKDLGLKNIADEDKSIVEDTDEDKIVEKDPEYVFITIKDVDLQTAKNKIDELIEKNPEWQKVSAFKNKNYYIIDYDLYKESPNNKWGESYKEIAELIK